MTRSDVGVWLTRNLVCAAILFISTGCDSTDQADSAEGPPIDGAWKSSSFEPMGSTGEFIGSIYLTLEIIQDGQNLTGSGQPHTGVVVGGGEAPTFVFSGEYRYPSVQISAEYTEQDDGENTFALDCFVDASELISCDYTDAFTPPVELELSPED